MKLTINYDNRYDILYLRPNPFVPSYADENEEGITTLRSIEDDTPVGMVIDGFKKLALSKELSNNCLPFSIDFSNPKIKMILSENALS